MGQIKKGGLYSAYIRKSRQDLEAEQQGQGETLARHRAILHAAAHRYGITIVEEYCEVVSGDTVAERPQMQRLLSDINAGRWDGVLVVDIDRLGRGDSVDQGIIFQSFLYSNTLIVTPDKIYDPQDDSDAEFFEIKLFFSRREYTMIKKRMQRGRLQSVLDGCYAGGVPPYGCIKVKLEGRKGYTLAPHPEQLPVLQMAFEMRVHGNNGQPMGIGAISRRLNKLGYRTANGKLWTPTLMQRVLSNPAYVGKVFWSTRPTVTTYKDGVRVKRRIKSDSPVIVDGLHEPLIDPELWNAAQEIRLQQYTPKTHEDLLQRNPFAGLVYCSKCGRVMRRYHKSNGKDWLKCYTPGCTTCAAAESAVEEAIIGTLRVWVNDFEAHPETPTNDRQKDSSVDVVKRLTDQRKTVESQLNRLYDLLEQGLYSADLFRTRRAELSTRIDSIDEAIADATAQQEDSTNRAEYIQKVKTVLEAYFAASTAEEQNHLLKSVIQKAILTKDQRCFKGDDPGRYLSIDVFPIVPNLK